MPFDGLSNRAFVQCLLAFAGLVFILYMPSSWSPGGLISPKSTKMQLSGHSSLQISADRAIVALRIEAEGSKQAIVSSEVRSIANEVLAYLRPLTKPENRTLEISEVAPVVDLSFVTFETSSWNKDTILGFESKVHRVKAEIDVEFSSMDTLGIALAKISKLPKLTIKSTKWKLSDTLKEQVLFQCREAAMRDLLAKFTAYTKPLKLSNIHAVNIYQASDWISNAEPKQRWQYAMHDELVLSDYDPGNRRQRNSMGYMALEDDRHEKAEEEAYTMETRSLKISAEVSGEFLAH